MNSNLVQIITVNPLTWESGYDYLLQAFSKAVMNKPHNLFLTIVGDGPLYAAIEYTIEDLKIDKNVNIIRETSDSNKICKLIDAADVYINVSVKYESNSADLQAILSGKRIIFSDINKFFINTTNSINSNKINSRDVRHLSKLISVYKNNTWQIK